MPDSLISPDLCHFEKVNYAHLFPGKLLSYAGIHNVSLMLRSLSIQSKQKGV